MLQLIRREFVVNVPLETVWQHLAQVERWPSWAKHITSVELDPPGDLTRQSSGAFRLSNGIRSTFKMVELNPPKSWKWVGPFLWIMVHYDHIFEPIDDQHTRLIWVVDAEGFAVSIFGRVYAAIYNRNLDKAIPNLVAEMNAQQDGDIG
jgi:hypothetical protein